MGDRKSDGSPASKRRKLYPGFAADLGCTPPPPDPDAPKGIDRPISPPLSKRQNSHPPAPSTARIEIEVHVPEPRQSAPTPAEAPSTTEHGERKTKYLSSPVKLTSIRDLAPHENVDAVSLRDLLCDPMIKECWNFNYLFDVDFVMQHFDPDVQDLVKVKIVHGFWRKDDTRRMNLMGQVGRYPNVEAIPAYIPDPFGTHHSKMLILFRHDDFCQVVIHTANMIARDWGNMTQAVWQSPLLPLHKTSATISNGGLLDAQQHPIGGGGRFKMDLLRYLDAYEKRLKPLTQQLVDYDFASIRAAFIGSVPSHQKPMSTKPSVRTSFGWLGLREILSAIPIQSTKQVTSAPNIVAQVSSIATLGANPTWITHFQSILSGSSSSSNASSTKTGFFSKTSSKAKSIDIPEPTFNIIFPTAHEIRTSLDGYRSGASIHTKIQSAAQQKQLEYLRPLFCHWNNSTQDPPSQPVPSSPKREAFRGPAAPHIKTYIRFSGPDKTSIDWAMVTSANLSKQAWGEIENKKEEVWIQSWETGIIVWPSLYGDADASAMVPMFGKDTPALENESSEGEGDGVVKEMVVGFRMPYDLPLVPYTADEVPWCATLSDNRPDWMGQTWAGH